MDEIYVVDTSVFLHDPDAIDKFKNKLIIIPAIVLDELNSFKKNYNLLGYAARKFLQKLDEYRQYGDLIKGIELNNSSSLLIKFYDPNITLPKELLVNKDKKVDEYILNVLVASQKIIQNDIKIKLISKDVNLRIKANYLSIDAEDYLNTKIENGIDPDGMYLVAPDDLIDSLYNFKFVEFNADIKRSDGKALNPFINEYFLMKSQDNNQKSVLVKYTEHVQKYFKKRVFKLVKNAVNLFGITAKNYKQEFVINALLDKNIDVCFIIGIAGSGKTLLAIAGGLTQVLDNKYERLIISRPIISFGKDPGALPGDFIDKTKPWLIPIYDNLDYILRYVKSDKLPDMTMDKKLTIEYLEDMGILEIQPLANIRGRSINNAIFLIDEAQNLTPHHIKTIISRAGFNTKIVFTGDIYQIDSPYLTPYDNGLIFAAQKLREHRYDGAATIYLDKGERSKLATAAANYL